MNLIEASLKRGTVLCCRVATDSDHEIHFWRVITGELVPAFTFERAAIKALLLKQFERKRVHFARGMTARTKCLEQAIAGFVEQCLGQNTTC